MPLPRIVIVGAGFGGLSAAKGLAGVSAEESVFIDNSNDNLVAPSALGFKTIFHDDEKNDIEALLRNFKTLGVFAGDA